MKCKPGQAAFVSTTELYSLLSPEEKVLAENSWVEWIENCKGRSNGLGLETEGKEHAMDEMPEWDDSKIKRYPMVWLTPTGKKALQVHGICVRRMFLRATPASGVRVVEDLVGIRELLHDWQERIIKPAYILMAPVEEGDVQMWDNRSVFHSAVDYPGHYGSRSMHQANLGASDPPVGPVPIPAM